MNGSLLAATGARRRPSWIARACVALLLVAVGASGAAAVTPVTVNVAPGAEVIIESSDQPLVNKTTKARGTITVDQAGTPPAVHRLLYRAPTDVTADLVEAIQYQKANDDLVASVHVNKPEGAKTQSLAVGDAFKVLAILFVLAVLLEQALSVIFNWRPFLQNFDARGVKTIVSVLVAWLVLETFQLDLVRDLVTVYTGSTASSGFSTKLLTAMILAGGSSGVNNVLVSLGFRSMRSADQIAPKPPPTEAWLAVRLIRKEVVGTVMVSIGPDGATPPVVGMIAGSSSKNGLLRFFLVDRGRFPMVGGHSLRPEAGRCYKVEVAGDRQGWHIQDQELGSLARSQRVPFSTSSSSCRAGALTPPISLPSPAHEAPLPVTRTPARELESVFTPSTNTGRWPIFWSHLRSYLRPPARDM